MKEGRVSYTAEGAAIMRAVESMKPEDERVCYDPLARHFPRARFRILGKSQLLSSIGLWLFAERVLPGGLGLVAARTRYIDEYLKKCIANGIRQLVIMGAGYDSRAYRFDELKGRVKVFELDHPATQAAKIDRIKKILGSLPDHVVYVAIDFDREKLDKRLFESGYDKNLKTLFIWEGVTYYISEQAVDETLAFVMKNSGDGSSILFDYLVHLDAYEPGIEARLKKWQQHCAQQGEPWTFGLEEGAIEGFLSERGFYQVVNATAKELSNSYLTGKNANRRIHTFLPIVHATVKPRG